MRNAASQIVLKVFFQVVLLDWWAEWGGVKNLLLFFEIIYITKLDGLFTNITSKISTGTEY